VALYAYQAAWKPFLETVVWKRVVRPAIKFVLAPIIVVHKLGWLDLIREFLDKHFR
jgi:hypothetical protein